MSGEFSSQRTVAKRHRGTPSRRSKRKRQSSLWITRASYRATLVFASFIVDNVALSGDISVVQFLLLDPSHGHWNLGLSYRGSMHLQGLENSATDPNTPIQYDPDLNEHNITLSGRVGSYGSMRIYHCPIVVGARPSRAGKTVRRGSRHRT